MRLPSAARHFGTKGGFTHDYTDDIRLEQGQFLRGDKLCAR